jgi:hypothetical protein
VADWIEHDELYDTDWAFSVPRTPEELASSRKFSVSQSGYPPQGFTCDNCKAAPRCKLVFDWYNTNGDCIAEK